MTTPHDPRARASFADPREVEEYVATLERFERGEIDADAWRAFCLLRGTYPQRQPGDVHMLRTKLPQGLVSAAQLEVLADVAELHSRGFAHVSTRQNLQLHFVSARGVEAALRRLERAGLTTREACGNAVRNVTACPFGGVSPSETFDTTPYAEALTRHFLRHPLSGTLPRKFKIAFEGCAEDHVAGAIHDIAFFARVRGGSRGFEVRIGGGTSTVPVDARTFAAFLPAGEVLGLAEAVLRVFDRTGDRENRARARMKFVVRRLGWEAFAREIDAELAVVRRAGVPPLPFDPEAPPEEGPPSGARPPPPAPAAIAASVLAECLRGPGLVPTAAPALNPSPGARAAFRRTNVRAQRQPGHAVVTVAVPLGDLTSAQLRALAALARAYADGGVRFTREQDVLLRWVRDEDVPALHEALAAAGVGLAGAGTAADVVSCPGAETCRIAVTHSRGLARLVEGHVRADGGLAERARGVDVKVSGCPNGCGQHHVATIGLQGSTRKVGSHAVPQYFVLLGGGVDPAGARFGRLAAKIPARRVPVALERLVALFEAERAPGEEAAAFFARVPVERARAALADLAALDESSLRPEDLVEPGEVLATPASASAAAGAPERA